MNAVLPGPRLTAVLAVVLVVGVTAATTTQMPDVRTMSGVPRPVEELAVGTVSVRVVRGSLADVVAGVPVELNVAGTPRVIRTDSEGRAEFTSVAPGKTVRASAVLDGVRLESEEFVVPSAGGVRLLLAAAPGGTAERAAAGTPGGLAAAAAPGTVVFGGDTRILLQFEDDELGVFYLLDIVNGGTAPVKTEPLVLDMPADAQGTAVLEGSTPRASVEGRRVTIAGPFAPGRTSVQIAYSLLPGSGRVRIAQRFPAALSQVTVVVQKVGELTVLSPAIREQRQVSDQGQAFLVGTGPGLAAGESEVLDLDGVPHRAHWPAVLALSLAALVLVAGGFAAIRPGPGAANAGRESLAAQREQVLADVQALDAQARAGRIDARRHATHRETLMIELERIYRALDAEADGRDGDERRTG